MPSDTPLRRRQNYDQALASSRLEGHVPSAAYLADIECVIAGTMTPEAARAASLARALAADAAAIDRRQSAEGRHEP